MLSMLIVIASNFNLHGISSFMPPFEKGSGITVFLYPRAITRLSASVLFDEIKYSDSKIVFIVSGKLASLMSKG